MVYFFQPAAHLTLSLRFAKIEVSLNIGMPTSSVALDFPSTVMTILIPVGRIESSPVVSGFLYKKLFMMQELLAGCCYI